MSQYDRNRVSRLPGWRSYEPSQTASEGVRLRSPVVRPDDFARQEFETAAPPLVPPSVRTAQTRRYGEASPAPAAEAAADIRLQGTSAPGAPLLDLRSGIAAIWSRRLVVLALALFGAVGGGVMAPLIGQKFTAVSSLYFDPRQIGLAETGAQSSGPSPEMISALIDSQVQILTSGNVLRRIVDAMKLDQDPEFTGGRTDGAAVIGALQKALVITRQTGTYVVSLAATTNDPEKSAKLANQVVASFTEEENSASNGLYENTSSTLDGRLADLRQKVLEAEQAVETFRADNDMAATAGNLISDQRLASLNTLLVTAQEKTIQAKARADAVANLRVEDIVAGNQAEGGATSPLVSLRQQYAAQAAAVGSLESQMGTRHPRLQAARSSLQSISGEIRGELQRLATSARGEYEQAKSAEDSIAKELAVQKALQATTSDKQVELNELQRKATAARDIYETVLKRSSQTSEEQSLSQSNIRVISPAEPPVKADGPGKKILMVAGIIGGFLAGFFLGAAFAILAGLFGHPVIRGYFRKSRPAAA
ncbi:GumC family protein [Rhizobium bangladeshense]|uniref:GumC family protein n=1 Tax=Rhizobium bangladeshense TaxID=1138189 RepID=UPI001A9899A4|nr:GumC family protein [Rhizobium bangladeshense]QSY94582.1 GumC family protein [Rhizobium bangladeshense]